jgi:hypothetical protein
MTKIFAAVVFIAGLAPAIALADPQAYLCIADQSVGFKYDKNLKEWRSAHFTLEDKRYLLKLKDNHWYWSTFGQTDEINCSDVNSRSDIVCNLLSYPDNEIDEMITFNQKRLRYQSVYAYGYAVPYREEDTSAFTGTPDTPSIEIGRCSAM